MKTHAWLQRLRRAPRSGGFSLPETLTSLGMAVVLTALVVGFVTVSMRTASAERADNESTRSAMVAMDRMTTYIKQAQRDSPQGKILLAGSRTYRTGNPATLAAGRNTGVEMTFYANLGHRNGPNVVHWYLDADNNLIEEVQEPDDELRYLSPAYREKDPTHRVLVPNVARPGMGDRPIFSYYPVNSANPMNYWADPNQPLVDWHSEAVAAVGISITTVDDDNKQATAENFAIMRDFFAVSGEAPAWPSTPTNPRPTPGGGGTGDPYIPPPPPTSGGGGGGGGGLVLTGPIGGLA